MATRGWRPSKAWEDGPGFDDADLDEEYEAYEDDCELRGDIARDSDD